MAQLIELFEEGWRVPDGDYGNLIFQNSHILIYSNRGDGVITTTAFSLDSDNRLVKKTMSSKTVRITEQWEEVIETPNAKEEDIFRADDYDLVASHLELDREALLRLLKSNFDAVIGEVSSLLSSVHLFKSQKEDLKTAIENIKTQQFAMQ